MSQVETDNWMRPDEFLRQQRKQLKLQKLQKRLLQKPSTGKITADTPLIPEGLIHQKRNNPFAKPEPIKKRIRRGDLEISDDTIFELIHKTAPQCSPNVEACDDDGQIINLNEQIQDNLAIVGDENEEIEKPSKIYQLKDLPVDWSIKSRVRILTKSQIIGNALKSSQIASGLTAFVRCLNMKSTKTRLDISDGARFHQNVMYFVHPNLPWLNMIQRNSPSNNTFQIGENELKPLLSDWKDSSINLFHLLRTLQCPFFYVLTNHFSILFRAAGIGGHAEMHAFVTPTTRGFRQTLKNEDIEFTMVLKNQQAKDNSNNSNSSIKSEPGTENVEEVDEEEEEEDELEFLESLGVDASQIRFKEDVKAKRKEAEDDNGDMSTILIEGHDCQSFFNFVLNDAKSIVTQVGRLSGIPPTLLAPVAFNGGTLKNQSVRTSKLKHEGIDCYSIELKGAILPQVVHTICAFLLDTKDTFSISMTSIPSTIAFTKGSKKMLENLDSSRAAADHYFGRENLSDCGLENDILEALTRVDGEAVSILENLHFREEFGGFTMF